MNVQVKNIFIHSPFLSLIMSYTTNDNICENLDDPGGEYIKSLYKSCFPQVRGMVLQNSGTLDHAKDIFQDALMALYQKCKEGNFKLTSSACTFLFGIARNKWLNELRRNKKFDSSDDGKNIEDESVKFDDDQKKQRQRLLAACITKLGEKCQNILQLYFEGLEGEKISAQLQFSSYEYYRLAKKRCIDNLKKCMEGDDLFEELKN